MRHCWCSEGFGIAAEFEEEERWLAWWLVQEWQASFRRPSWAAVPRFRRSLMDSLGLAHPFLLFQGVSEFGLQVCYQLGEMGGFEFSFLLAHLSVEYLVSGHGRQNSYLLVAIAFRFSIHGSEDANKLGCWLFYLRIDASITWRWDSVSMVMIYLTPSYGISRDFATNDNLELNLPTSCLGPNMGKLQQAVWSSYWSDFDGYDGACSVYFTHSKFCQQLRFESRLSESKISVMAIKALLNLRCWDWNPNCNTIQPYGGLLPKIGVGSDCRRAFRQVSGSNAQIFRAVCKEIWYFLLCGQGCHCCCC